MPSCHLLGCLVIQVETPAEKAAAAKKEAGSGYSKLCRARFKRHCPPDAKREAEKKEKEKEKQKEWDSSRFSKSTSISSDQYFQR